MADKWGRRLFLAGAIWLLLMGAVHSLSFIKQPTPQNETERQLFDLMSNYKFNVAGAMRSMDNFMTGFSICFMLAALGLGLLDLSLVKERAALLRRISLVNILWLAVMVVIALRYFFIVPTTFLSVALLIFALAWLKLPSESTA
ncbi:MAG TPA: hypothetical protein VJO16_05030 [Candidatus Acidoferrum sp.]|nr:hypothetical protein [Candidatus Acidoferrum sp.]